MSDEIRQEVERAVERAFDRWAAEHPTLASAVDRITLCRLTATSLRESEQYRAAVDAYRRDMRRADLAERLVGIAAGLLGRFMT